MESNNVIELNGKRYDAVTGKYLGRSHTQAVPAPGVKTVDGVIRPSNSHPHTRQAQSAAHHRKPVQRQEPKHTTPHHPQHAKTLMRHVVTKPQTPQPKKKHDITQAVAQPLAIKQSVANVDPARQHRAFRTQRHSDIRRFTAAPRASSVAAPRPVQPAPRQVTTQRKPVAPNSERANTDIFEAAIAHATSHQQPRPKVARHRSRGQRIARTLTGIAILLVLSGFAAWTQRGAIELQIASWQEGFKATAPEYVLTGYERGTLEHKHGKVAITFRSGSNHYRIIQQASDWNSQTLLDNAVAGASTKDMQTIESKGRIIYIYGNNASWVDGGVRYDITGNAPLNEKDIVTIVDSM